MLSTFSITFPSLASISVVIKSRFLSLYNVDILTMKDSRYPNGKVIDPTTDVFARETDKGWMCGICIGEQNSKMLSLFGRGEKK